MLPRERLLGGLLMATPWCAFAALTFAAFQQFILGYRPQGGDGNAGVFAVTSAIVLAFALANVLDAKRPRNTVFALGGLFAAAATLILSETRALWPCLAIFPVVLWLTTQRHGESGPRRRIAALATLVIVAAALLFAATIYKRTEQAGADIAAAEMGKNATSLGKRLVIWKVAIGAIAERPLLGHGIDSPRRIMDARTAKVGGTTIAYSHFHNFVLDEMVRAGLVGTIALIAMLAVPFFAAASHVRDRTASIGFGLLICVQTAFLLSGSVNIMLHHDIMDAQFLANTVLCLYFVFGRRGEAEEADAEPMPGAGAVTEASHLQEDRK